MTQRNVNLMRTKVRPNFTVSFLGKPSVNLQNRVKSEIKKYGLTIIPSYTTTAVGSYFSLKTNCSRPFKSNVTYKFTCAEDQQVSYIGETKRQLFKRVSEHTKTDKNSAVFNHLFNCAARTHQTL